MDARQMLAFMADTVDKIAGREIFYLIASIVLLLSAIVLIVIVLIQSNSSKGLSGAIAGGSDTFYGRTKGNSIEKKLTIVTIAVAVAFAIISLTIYALQSNLTLEDWWNDLISNNTSTSTSTDDYGDEEKEESSENENENESETENEGTTEGEGSQEGGSTEGGTEGEGANG